MASCESAVLTLDLGSTWMKAGWVRSDGTLVTVDRAASPLQAQVLDAEAIWQSVAKLLNQLSRAGSAPAKVLGIALTGVTRSHVFIDGAGRPLAPVVLWDDPYGEAQAAKVAAAYGAPSDASGFGAFHPLARLLQFSEERGAAPDGLIELKDWLNFRLTGRQAMDSVAYGRLAPASALGGTAARVLSRLGFPVSVLPVLAQPTDILGSVSAPEFDAGSVLSRVPVVVSGFDTWASTLGMGAIELNGAYDISGTTEAMGVFSASRQHIPGMVSIAWTPTLWHSGGPCQTGMGTLAWFARSFLDSDEPVATLAEAQKSRGIDLPVCLPYLSGERMPLWSSTLSASFQGVKPHHRRCDFARALVEGLALAHRLALDAMGARAHSTVVHMGGGGSLLSYWVQCRANAFGLSIRVGSSSDSALVGAALAALIGLGRYEDIQAAQRAVQSHGRLFTPEPDGVRYFESRVKEFSRMLHRDLSAP